MAISRETRAGSMQPAKALTFLFAAALLPLGMTFAQDTSGKTEAYLKKVRDNLSAKVEAGEMTAEEAANKMAALEKKAAFVGVTPKTPPVAAPAEFWDAVVSGDTEAIKKHLEAGASVNARHEASGGGTPLTVAALFGHSEAAALLLAKGVPIDGGNRDGHTPLHAAAFFGQADMVSLLLERGANVNAGNREGRSPLDVVSGEWSQELEETYRGVAEALQLELDLELIREARPAIVALLRENGGKAGRRNEDVWPAAMNGDVEAIKHYVAAGGHLNLKEPAHGATPLIVASFFGHTDAAGTMIEHGALPELRNNDGNTALHLAAAFGWPETVKCLLEKGADVRAQNNKGERPLDVVSAAWTEELAGVYRTVAAALKVELDLERIEAARPKIAALLREHGAAR